MIFIEAPGRDGLSHEEGREAWPRHNCYHPVVRDLDCLKHEPCQPVAVSAATLKRWRRQHRETGALTPKPKPGRPPRIGRDQHATLTAQVEALPDATLAEHCAAWTARTGVVVSPATMCRQLRKLNLPLKNNASLPASGTRPPARRGGVPPQRSTRAP